MWHQAIQRPRFWIGALTASLFAASCAATVPMSEFNSVKDQLAARDQELAKLKEGKPGTTPATTTPTTTTPGTTTQAVPTTIVQVGQLQPVATSSTDAWSTAESVRGGLTLVAKFDSSGPDAWTPPASGTVYMSSEGTEDSNPAYKSTDKYFAGFHVVDAYTRAVLHSFKVENAITNPASDSLKITRFPHGFCVSPDGKWGYVGWGQQTADGKSTEGVVAVVNMRTMKLDKLLKQESYFQGGTRSQNLHHVQAFKDWQGRDRVILMWGFGSDGGPHHILDPNDDNKVIKAITRDDVWPMGHPFTTNSPDGKYVYVSMGANWVREAECCRAAIGKLNLQTGLVSVIEDVGSHPIGITHTMDGKTTYVVDGTNSFVFKIDNATNKVLGHTSAGVAGPYGIALNWDETRAYVIGKGEGSHNLGNVVGVINLKTFKPASDVDRAMPISLGGSASSVDHGILHPDPARNELWVSSMNGWETIVVDLNTHKSVAWIPTPNGGNTHSGCFVKYNADWTAELLADQGGPKGKTMTDAVKAKVAALAGS